MGCHEGCKCVDCQNTHGAMSSSIVSKIAPMKKAIPTVHIDQGQHSKKIFVGAAQAGIKRKFDEKVTEASLLGEPTPAKRYRASAPSYHPIPMLQQPQGHQQSSYHQQFHQNMQLPYPYQQPPPQRADSSTEKAGAAEDKKKS